VVGKVRVAQALERAAADSVQAGGRGARRVGAERGFAVEGDEARLDGHGQQRLARAGHHQPALAAFNLAIGAEHANPGGEPRALRGRRLVVRDGVFHVAAVVRLGADGCAPRQQEVAVPGDASLVTQLARGAHGELEGAGRRGGETHHQDAIGMRDEVLALEGRPRHGERRPGGGGVEIELAAESGSPGDARLGRLDVKVAERRVRRRELPLQLAGQLVGQLVVALEQRLAHLRQPGPRIGIDLGVDGSARPQRGLVQHHPLGRNAAEHRRANPPVPERQRLFEGDGRLVVPEPQPGVGRRRLARKEEEKARRGNRAQDEHGKRIAELPTLERHWEPQSASSTRRGCLVVRRMATSRPGACGQRVLSPVTPVASSREKHSNGGRAPGAPGVPRPAPPAGRHHTQRTARPGSSRPSGRSGEAGSAGSVRGPYRERCLLHASGARTKSAASPSAFRVLSYSDLEVTRTWNLPLPRSRRSTRSTPTWC